MTKEIKENSKTIDRELNDYYQQVEKDVREQTNAYLTGVKQVLETYRTKVQSDYCEMQKVIDDNSSKITAEVKTLTSTQVKTLEAEKENQEMNRISIQSIRDFVQQLTDTGSDIDVMTHSKKLQTKIQELQTSEPVFDTKTTDITFTPGKKMDLVLLFPKIPEPRPLSIKKGSITAKTYRGPFDACFGSLKQETVCYPELMEFQKVTLLETRERQISFYVRRRLWDTQCTDDGCFLVACGIMFLHTARTVCVFSSTGELERELVK
ncbi:uncharacterized protein LOC106179208 [Lingula anatina]|uniref:Uncharacterized protein LOC106179208 n=1 Tax=Lingula anatina TaxID=7574 RepID=A0A1S3K6R9_LINAN|nr:uncharacterized protein LOC106179208 [Lingula anatina]|eukprot:XP_013418197.1 uncharacterized protein LOC106179208 [Lingula anatina]